MIGALVVGLPVLLFVFAVVAALVKGLSAGPLGPVVVVIVVGFVAFIVLCVGVVVLAQLSLGAGVSWITKGRWRR